MLDWLLSPIDPTRAHEIGFLVSWHGRLMVTGWGVLLPAGVFIARFLKLWPKQNWPEQLHNRNWWRSHLALQWTGALVALIGFGLILSFNNGLSNQDNWHRWFGLSALALLLIQVLGGVFRGTKGGPTDPAADGTIWGDHYNMSRRRVVFEYCHKSLGYVALLCAAAAIVTGLWDVNAQRWIVVLITLWWLTLASFAIVFQRSKRVVDTYQAIWGLDDKHPGNALKPIGIGIHKLDPQRLAPQRKEKH